MTLELGLRGCRACQRGPRGRESRSGRRSSLSRVQEWGSHWQVLAGGRDVGKWQEIRLKKRKKGQSSLAAKKVRLCP